MSNLLFVIDYMRSHGFTEAEIDRILFGVEESATK